MKSRKILVVEDEALVADDIQRTLVRLGYEVPLTAATGREAIAAAAELLPDLALMDIKLQGAMDGIEAAIVIRREHDIPIIYLTSHSDDATLARAMETSPSGYLLKPFSDRELKTAIEVALHKHMLEARLAERERWFSTTLQSIGDAVIATDRNEVITFMNAVAETLTGWQSGDAIGRPIGEVFHIVDPKGNALGSSMKLALLENFAVEVPQTVSLVVRGGGAQLAVDDSAAPIVDGKGNVLGRVVVFRDVTARKKLEQRLTQSERLASLGALAAGMGHEINNPLMAVVGNLGFAVEIIRSLKTMLAVNPLPEPQVTQDAVKKLNEAEDALVDANKAADRVREIVLDLTKLIKSESSTRTILELSEILDAAAKTTSMARHDAKLLKEYGVTPFVEANEGQLIQVFTNLLVNAAQAVQGSAAEHQTIRLITYTDSAGRAIAEVHDSGPGISADVLAKIFDPFFTTKSFGEGMGLGLTISHKIVTTLGGELGVESKPGQGAVFRVALPGVRARPISTIIPGPPDEVAGARRGTLLVVDDEPSVGRSLERILRKDHDVTVVSSGADALAKIASVGFYDVVFCDLMMPKISGMDVYESLAPVNPEQARRMVFMTGGAFTPRAQEFLESTGNILITKPFTAESARAIARDYVK